MRLEFIMSYYREILQQEYQARLQKNTRFSRNSYARFLNISPSYYSKLMSKNITLSLQKADEISKKLEFNPELRKKFIISVADELRDKAIKELDPSLLIP